MINDLCYVAFTLRLFYRLSVLTFPPIHHTEPCCLCIVYVHTHDSTPSESGVIDLQKKYVLVDMYSQGFLKCVWQHHRAGSVIYVDPYNSDGVVCIQNFQSENP